MTFLEMKSELDELNQLRRTIKSLRDTNKIQNDIIDRWIGKKKDVLTVITGSLNESLSNVTKVHPDEYEQGIADGLKIAIEVIESIKPKTK